MRNIAARREMLKTVSIIIPVKEVNDYIAESLGEINKLDYGLKKVDSAPSGATFEALDGTCAVVRKSGDAGLHDRGSGVLSRFRFSPSRVYPVRE